MSEQEQQVSSYEQYIFRQGQLERVMQLSPDAISEYQESFLDHLAAIGALEAETEEEIISQYTQLMDYNAKDFYRLNHMSVGDTIMASGEGIAVVATENGSYRLQDLSKGVVARGTIHRPVVWDTPALETLNDITDEGMVTKPHVTMLSSAVELQDVSFELIENQDAPIIPRPEETHHVYLSFVYEGMNVAIVSEEL